MIRLSRWHLFLLLQYSIFNIQYSIASPVDSIQPLLGKKGELVPSTKNDTWYMNADPGKHFIIDSSIFHIEDFNVVQRSSGREYANLGNSGTAAYPLVFDINRSTGFNLGYNQFDVYRYQKDSVKYYQVIRPYAELSMVIGLKNEQVFQGNFANQHKGIIFYGVEFRRIFSKGIYTNQRTNDNGFNLYGIFNSRNKRWNIQADLIFNSFKPQENGGVQANVFDSSFFQKTLVPVNLTAAENKYTQVDFYLKSSYNVGKKYSIRANDSTTNKVLMPVFRISHQLNIESNKNKFHDLSPDLNPDYYGSFYTIRDSVANDLNYLKVGNALMLDYFARKLTSDSTYSEKNFVISAEVGFDYFILSQNELKSNTTNFYVSGNIRSNGASASKLFYKASAKYFPFGWNQNDLIADAVVGYYLGKVGMVSGNFTYQLKEAPYMYERYTSHPVNWNFDLPKTKTMAAGFKYQNVRYGLTADFNYYIVDHLPVYPGFASPYLTTGIENAFVVHAGNRNSFHGLHLDNDVWFTSTANDGLIRKTYPMLVTKHSIYYENRLFKKMLWLAVGFDLRYRYKNNAPYYEPMLGAFYPVTATNKSYPILDFFLNLKIKTVRVFLKVSNISSSFGPKGYYSLYGYPAADISFQFGIKWRFFE